MRMTSVYEPWNEARGAERSKVEALASEVETLRTELEALRSKLKALDPVSFSWAPF